MIPTSRSYQDEEVTITCPRNIFHLLLNVHGDVPDVFLPRTPPSSQGKFPVCWVSHPHITLSPCCHYRIRISTRSLYRTRHRSGITALYLTTWYTEFFITCYLQITVLYCGSVANFRRMSFLFLQIYGERYIRVGVKKFWYHVTAIYLFTIEELGMTNQNKEKLSRDLNDL